MIAAQKLEPMDGIVHGFFTREGGHSAGLFASLNCGYGSGDDRETVAKNRREVASDLDVAESDLLTAWQCHSPEVVVAQESWDVLKPPRGDAIVTARRGIAVGVLTADCAPVLFCDAEARVIGAAHAGWKGALAGVTDATIRAMEALAARRERVIAVIGPTISQESYEVGPELRQIFVAQSGDNDAYFAPCGRPHHFLFNLPGYLKRRLERQGLLGVVDMGLCTYCDEARFFSYRRATHRQETAYGRQISAIALKD